MASSWRIPPKRAAFSCRHPEDQLIKQDSLILFYQIHLLTLVAFYYDIKAIFCLSLIVWKQIFIFFKTRQLIIELVYNIVKFVINYPIFQVIGRAFILKIS